MMNHYKAEMIAAISRLVEIPSVFAESSEYPFGAAVDHCLDVALAMMAGLGFRTFKAPDGMYGYAEIGEGELFGVLCHLDVVQARREDGWEHDPFRPMVQGDWLCGRGTQDDKGPSVAAIYALKSLLDEGHKLNKRVRFIFGIDEETMWDSIHAYCDREERPVSGFVPDSTFPLTYAEKGLLQLQIRSGKGFALPCRGGDSMNAVSAHAECPHDPAVERALRELEFAFHMDGDTVCVEGLTAHAKNPWKGVNANLHLLRALRQAGYEHDAITFACDMLDEKFRFEGFSQEDLSDFSGPVTVNLGKFSLDEQGAVLGIDLRLPVTCEKETILALVREKAAACHMTVEEFDWLRPIHVPLDSPLVSKLLQAYREVTGDAKTEPYISAGATFARAFDNCVAFGANMPHSPTSEHQPNERISIIKLMQATEVYRRAFSYLVLAD
ncbi:Sapep family Mn(2+)-dependent dipeptidase [Gemmiger formicilis]|uniref:Sapep family Mn(2+)-dependent dipeptidase n=1 Tax=Gemmiger formicilis TaxID=745368 RepID=UPI00195B4F7B|nr:Sapep family Mn(2+)-dependent dipeptidase [Gemmiger formicilis]MBM6899925.1 Sapep family Mn(2+)-dependent dipeptidase [Gemmiger formicilis]